MTKKRSALFVHDGPIYKDVNQNFYGVHYDNNMISRYFELADEVTFLMRSGVLETTEHENYSKIDLEGFTVVEVPEFKSFKKWLKNRKLVEEQVANEVARHDLIVARVPSALSSLAIKMAARLGKSILIEVVACNWDALWNYSWKGKSLAPYFFLKQKKIIKHAAFVIYVTKVFLQKRYPTYGVTIACSDVEIGTSDELIIEQRLQKINKLVNTKSLVFGTIAAIDVPYKGQGNVIKAISILNDLGFNIQYRLVGQGDPDRIRELIKSFKLCNQIHIEGPIAHEKVNEFLDNIDVYIQPSKQEGLPRALIEAMSRGCPSIGANTAGIPELINNDMVYDKSSVKELVKLIKKLSPEKLKSEAIENYNESENYQSEILRRRRMEFYHKFLEKSGLV